jgi:hypothetical protein
MVWNGKGCVIHAKDLPRSDRTDNNSSRYEGHGVSPILRRSKHLLVLRQLVCDDLAFLLCHMRDILLNSTFLTVDSDPMCNPFFDWR